MKTKKKNRIDWLAIALGLAGTKANGRVDCQAAARCEPGAVLWF
jgi:hypothetical protein